tara:strand:- start:3904 stop:5952 length:2049 start_codon:yes stop_codon:yes gene_type:complete
MRNILDTAASPYLIQHKDNPVHWQVWGPDAFAEATRNDKPILLSIGYAACHWCHVMAHESFEDDAIAGLMNDLFVNIKVDREERPDVDAIYQQTLQLLGQNGGWPLTMFLTPQGDPFWGGTYFPPDSRYGRPGFPDVLRQMHAIYSDQRDKVTENSDAIKAALANLSQPPDVDGPIQLSTAVLDQAATQFLRALDPVNGGLVGAPKFPQPSIFDFLWRAHIRGGEKIFEHSVSLSLNRMCQGGIYDHLGGGFARYSTDETWLVPHFEKMLYDNAQLIALMTSVWRKTGSALYAERIRETIGWTLREMLAEGDAFAASQDADSEGEEGRFYVWTEAEVDEALSDATLFKKIYDVSPGGNWEGNAILNRSAHPDPLDDASEAALVADRQILFAIRDKRIKPGWDDKVLADWNGLMISAMASAGAAFAEPSWIASARQAFNFIKEKMSTGDRLLHCFRDGRATEVAFLDDYANMAHAALALFEITGEPTYLNDARTWVETVESHYLDSAHGGYFLTADDAETLITRPRNAADNATPSGNGIMALVLARLYHLMGEEIYRQRAESLCLAFAGEIHRNFMGITSLLSGFELLANAVQVAVIGVRDNPNTRMLVQTYFESPVPTGVLQVIPPGTALATSHPASGKTMIDDRPTAYVCHGTSCSLPIVDPASLRVALNDPVSATGASPA